MEFLSKISETIFLCFFTFFPLHLLASNKCLTTPTAGTSEVFKTLHLRLFTILPLHLLAFDKFRCRLILCDRICHCSDSSLDLALKCGSYTKRKSRRSHEWQSK